MLMSMALFASISTEDGPESWTVIPCPWKIELLHLRKVGCLEAQCFHFDLDIHLTLACCGIIEQCLWNQYVMQIFNIDRRPLAA